MKIEKLSNSFIQRTYKSEIDLLETQTKFYHNIDTKNDEIIINERKFKILPKLKFIRGDETKIILSDKIIKRVKIIADYTIEKKTIIIDCTKFHNDYIEKEIETKKIQ